MTIANRYSERQGRVGGHFRDSFHKARAARVARLAFNRCNESTSTCNCAVGPRLNIALVDRPVPPDGAFAHLDANVKSCRAFGDLQVAGNFLVRKQSEQKLRPWLSRAVNSWPDKRCRSPQKGGALSLCRRGIAMYVSFVVQDFPSLTFHRGGIRIFHRGGIRIRATRTG